MSRSDWEPEDDDLTTPVLPWAMLIATLALVIAATRGAALPSGPGLAVPTLAYVGAELLAPGLAGMGRFPLSSAALLVAAAPPFGPAPALFCAFTGTVVRCFRLRGQGVVWISELLPELLAVLAMASAGARLPGHAAAGLIPLGAVAYLASWLLMPALFAQALPPAPQAAWSMSRERSLAGLGFLVALATAAGWSAAQPAVPALLLFSVLLLAIPLQSQVKVLEAEVKDRQHARTDRAQARKSNELQQLQGRVELQKLEVEMQHRVLTLVGELFLETSQIQAPAELRPALLAFIRRTIPCSRVSLYEREHGQLFLSAGYGAEAHQPRAELLERLAVERVRASQLSDGGITHLAAQIPDRGLLVVSDPQPRWQAEDQHLLLRLANQLPLCLDALRYREMQSRMLGEEQARRKELDRLAARLTACLDLLGQLVALRTVPELIGTARSKLPELMPGYQVELEWQGEVHGARPGASPTDYTFPLYGGRTREGRLRLHSAGGHSLGQLDVELLRLFSSQLACLLEGAELNAQLRQTLERLKQSQAQLVQSSKMAAIGQLAAGVAHELNTPLGAISIAVELAAESVKQHPDRAERRLHKALESVTQMQEIIAKLLFYSRDSRGVRNQVELGKVMQDSFQLVAHTLKLNGVHVEVAPGPEVVVEANANELQQVFSNLLINAKDACTAPGALKKRIEMWLERTPDRALVHVRDYGCGMDEATRQRIFDPFFTTKAIGEGTGLGLSTSLELIQQHNGKLSCDSQPGQGTHFVVTLPFDALPG